MLCGFMVNGVGCIDGNLSFCFFVLSSNTYRPGSASLEQFRARIFRNIN